MSSSASRTGRRADPATQQRWQQRLERFRRSGLTVSAFCESEGVSTASFYTWRRRLRQLPAERANHPAGPLADRPRLVPVRLLTPAAPIELLLPGGLVLRLSPGCDLDFVRTLLATLGDRPC